MTHGAQLGSTVQDLLALNSQSFGTQTPNSPKGFSSAHSPKTPGREMQMA